ncbi:hypothetical protein FE257_011772 [Aspergillus nanangensis]|uniref:Prion-inhibition and propagation HeLo domain-containing protein n=1 Tax=Aspergillus nanangensis TaxID=2582783 RepID=A0AAD4CV92_ASPNN|nr:hypothetical protein FE257_011772 [Aspergillus nanangensis]
MTDPISIAGFAIGGASLTFQLFSGCVKGYNLLSDANGMPAQLQYLRVRLKIEQHRLLNWAEVVKLSEQANPLTATVIPHENLVQEILREKDTILNRFVKVQSSLENDSRSTLQYELQERFPHRKHSLEARALRYIDKARRYPTRLRWATFDKETFERLLGQLSALNDFMKSLLDLQQQRCLHDVQTQTSLQVLQLNNKIDHLLEIFHANSMPASPGAPGLSERLDYLKSVATLPAYTPEADSHELKLATLARFKALNIATIGTTRESNLILDPQCITILRSSSPDLSEGLFQRSPIWIEWKPYTPHLHPPPSLPPRIAKLASLLNSPDKPSQLHTAHCLGYFNDCSDNRIGLVFQRPRDPSSAHALTSLHTLLSEESPPSLTRRIRLASLLATALHHLHSLSWLHKALRSHNIVFFSEVGNVDLAAPYVCGFGLARPAQEVEMTETPDTNPVYNLYRHPLAHGEAATEGIDLKTQFI